LLAGAKRLATCGKNEDSNGKKFPFAIAESLDILQDSYKCKKPPTHDE
jgi:hypothetical protein